MASIYGREGVFVVLRGEVIVPSTYLLICILIFHSELTAALSLELVLHPSGLFRRIGDRLDYTARH